MFSPPSRSDRATSSTFSSTRILSFPEIMAVEAHVAATALWTFPGSGRYAHGLAVRLFVRPISCIEGSRSEEHTSELQSLMRISYAVFCLKKKKISKNKDSSKIGH